MEIIKEAGWAEDEYYEINFYDNDGCVCFGWYTDRIGGEPNIDAYNSDAMINWNYANSNPSLFHRKDEKRTVRYWEPALAVCDCGEEFYLENQWLGACECPNCGQWYNVFGQWLNPPETWPYGDDW